MLVSVALTIKAKVDVTKFHVPDPKRRSSVSVDKEQTNNNLFKKFRQTLVDRAVLVLLNRL